VRHEDVGGVEAAQERLLHAEQLGGPAGGVGREVLVVEVAERHRELLKWVVD
jgi:hypothetical protein